MHGHLGCMGYLGLIVIRDAYHAEANRGQTTTAPDGFPSGAVVNQIHLQAVISLNYDAYWTSVTVAWSRATAD